MLSHPVVQKCTWLILFQHISWYRVRRKLSTRNPVIQALHCKSSYHNKRGQIHLTTLKGPLWTKKSGSWTKADSCCFGSRDFSPPSLRWLETWTSSDCHWIPGFLCGFHVLMWLASTRWRASFLFSEIHTVPLVGPEDIISISYKIFDKFGLINQILWRR